jgi:hypothetical protein
MASAFNGPNTHTKARKSGRSFLGEKCEIGVKSLNIREREEEPYKRRIVFPLLKDGFV